MVRFDTVEGYAPAAVADCLVLGIFAEPAFSGAARTLNTATGGPYRSEETIADRRPKLSGGESDISVFVCSLVLFMATRFCGIVLP